MKLEDLQPGASAISADGHKLGTLSRFVINTGSLRLTHVVVDTGILRSGEPLWKGGWGLSHDRVVPLGVVADAEDGRVRLTMSADEFKDLSVDYIQEHFEMMPDDHPGWPDTSDVRRLLASLPGEPGPYMLLENRVMDADEVEIKKDASVWRLNPHKKIGEIDGLVYDEETQKVTDLVIRRGFVFTKDVVLPTRFFVEVAGDVVRVDIDDASLAGLAEFTG